MNKKLAALLLAIAIGAASSQALAVCFECHRAYQECIANGYPLADCNDQQVTCNDACER